tara:strand:+ start:135 stop:362 length:228 start_codon:yes stop_codon:yes gene_type:complete
MEVHWKNRGFGNYDAYYKGRLRGRVSSVYGKKRKGWRVLFPNDPAVTYILDTLNLAKEVIESHIKHTEKLNDNIQ